MDAHLPLETSSTFLRIAKSHWCSGIRSVTMCEESGNEPGTRRQHIRFPCQNLVLRSQETSLATRYLHSSNSASEQPFFNTHSLITTATLVLKERITLRPRSSSQRYDGQAQIASNGATAPECWNELPSRSSAYQVLVGDSDHFGRPNLSRSINHQINQLL
jgi:hypothetical protein